MEDRARREKQNLKRTTAYFTEKADEWLAERAREDGMSKNDVLRMLIRDAMRKGGGT